MKRSVEIHAAGKVAVRRAFEEVLCCVTRQDGVDVVDKDVATGVPVLFEITPREDGVFVEMRPGKSSTVRYEGREVTSVLVPWGEEVFVNGVRLAFVLDASSAERARGLVLVLGVAAAVGALFFGLGQFGSRSRSAEVEPPELGANQPSCAEPDARSAEERARASESAGLAKRERYPFDPAEGPEALTLLREAAACFRSAGRIQDAARAEDAAREWGGRLQDEYAALRARLTLALDRKRSAEALGAAKELELLLGRIGDHPYRDWLAARRKELEKKPASARK